MPTLAIKAAHPGGEFILDDLFQLRVAYLQIFPPAHEHVLIVRLDVQRLDDGTAEDRGPQFTQSRQFEENGHRHIENNKGRSFIAFRHLMRDHAPEQRKPPADKVSTRPSNQ